MGNGGHINVEEDEKRIIRIIKRIKKNKRNKAYYQNILAFARREDKDLTIESIRVTVKYYHEHK